MLSAATGRIGAQQVDEEGIILTSCFDGRQRAGGTLSGEALVGLYGTRRVAASILLRGAEDPPLTVIATDTSPHIEAVLDEVARLTHPGLVTTRRTRLLAGEIAPVELGEDPGEATRLTVYFSRQDRVYQVPAFEAACELLHRRGIAGATVLCGAEGTTRGRHQHAQFFQRDADVPVMVIAVGSGDRIGLVLPELGAMSRHPLMTIEKVLLCKRGGQLLSRPPAVAGAGGQGGPAWLKLTVYTSGAAQHEGQPVHRAITRQLRSAGIGGTTSLRGIWGFHGDRAPHGDRFLQLKHRAPVVTTVTGPPEQVAEAFDVIDKMTAERGLVTAETVTEVRPAGP